MARSPIKRELGDEYFDSQDDIPLKDPGCKEACGDQDIEYPSAKKLIPILVGLCFQSFCIALVSLTFTCD